jgi:hypothetical protein
MTVTAFRANVFCTEFTFLGFFFCHVHPETFSAETMYLLLLYSVLFVLHV